LKTSRAELLPARRYIRLEAKSVLEDTAWVTPIAYSCPRTWLISK